MKKGLLNSSGYILIFAIVFMAIMALLTGAMLSYANLNKTASSLSKFKVETLHIAEAGIDKAIQELNADVNFSGESNVPLGAGNFSTSISSIDQYTKKITSVGSVVDPNGRATSRTISAVAAIDVATVSFSYGVQVGEGGLSMNNNSVIEGNVFATGNITGSGTITGDATVTVASAAVANDSSTVSNADFLFGNTSARANTAVSFVPTASDSLTKISAYLKKTGTPGNITVKIVTNNNGSPSKTVLASGTISASSITTSYGWVDASLTTNPSLTAGTTYWIILIASVNANNHYSWGMQNTLVGGKYSSNWSAGSPVWTLAGGKFAYKTFLGDTPTYISGVNIGGTARASSLVGCDIGGDAYFETTNSCTVGGALHPGTPAPSPVSMPISDAQIAEWKAIAEAGGVYNGDYVINGTVTLNGPYKINGNLTLNNNATLYLKGPLWVNGDISNSNNSYVRVHSSLGNAGTIIIADYPADTTLKGKISISNNGHFVGNGGSASFPLVISTYSGTGNAIDVQNNADSTIFYAPYGAIDLSNGASVKEMTGKSVHLNNNAYVEYESGLQDAHFSTGPGGSWNFVPGTYVITE